MVRDHDLRHPLVRVAGLRKVFTERRWWSGERPGYTALHDVNLSLGHGRILGLVGLSGSGKSTLARCLAGFEAPTSGECHPTPEAVQLIFQDAAASLNPRFTAAEVVGEPARIRGQQPQPHQWMRMVGLDPAASGKPALEFSGGERQRLAIARALSVEPALLILDESLSGLDFVLQEQIGRLLLDLRERLQLTFIVITHDLALAARLADEIAVMDGGTIVEQAVTAELLAHPRHRATQTLVEASRALAIGGAL